MGRPRIRYDESPAVCLVYCSCGWRELSATRDGARRVADWHEGNVHPDSHVVRDTNKRIRERTRQAERSRRMSAPQRDTGEHGPA